MIASIVPKNGLYRATAEYRGTVYMCFGLTHLDALDRLFAKLATVYE